MVAVDVAIETGADHSIMSGSYPSPGG